jgi:hypothetical protein
LNLRTKVLDRVETVHSHILTHLSFILLACLDRNDNDTTIMALEPTRMKQDSSFDLTSPQWLMRRALVATFAASKRRTLKGPHTSSRSLGLLTESTVHNLQFIASSVHSRCVILLIDGYSDALYGYEASSGIRAFHKLSKALRTNPGLPIRQHLIAWLFYPTHRVVRADPGEQTFIQSSYLRLYLTLAK